MTLEEIDATLADAEKRLGHLQVSTEERESAMVAGEVGKYPGDEAVIPQFETAGKQEFQKLRTDRLKLTEQVKKARVEDQAFKDRESLWGQTKQFASDLFAPHDLIRGAVPPKPATAPSVQALDAPQQELTLPEVQIRVPHPDAGARLPAFTNPDEEEAFKSWYSGQMPVKMWPRNPKDAPVDPRQAFIAEMQGDEPTPAPPPQAGIFERDAEHGGGVSSRHMITVQVDELGPDPVAIPLLVPGNEHIGSTMQGHETDANGIPIPGGRTAPGLAPDAKSEETKRAIQWAIQHPDVVRPAESFQSSQPTNQPFMPSVQALDRPRSVAPDDIVGDVKPAPNLFAPGVTGRLDAQIGKTSQDPTARYPSAIPDKPFTDDAREVGRQIIGGAVVDLPKMGGQALQALSAEGTVASKAGQTIAAAAKLRELGWAPDLKGRGGIAEIFIKGGRAIAPSIATIAAYLNPYGAVLGPVATVALFGGSQFQEEYDKVKAAGGTEEDARNAGIITGALQGGGEVLANTLTLGMFGAGKGLAKEGIKRLLGESTDASVVKPWASSTGKALVGETGTEITQDIGTAYTEQQYGLKTESMLDIAKESGKAAIGMTLLLSPFGLAGHYRNAERANAINTILSDPSSSTPEDRMIAVRMLHEEATKLHVHDANDWFRGAVEDVKAGRPVRRTGNTAQADTHSPRIPTPAEAMSGPAKTSSAVANSPFGAEPTPKTGIPQVDALPDELQVAPVRPPSLIKQQPSPAAPVVTPGTVPTSQNQAPLSVSPEGGPLSVPLPPASAPGMESPSLAPQPAVTPEAIVQGADQTPLPDWLREGIDRNYAQAEKMGIVEKIRALAADGKVAGEIAKELGVDKELVRSVRAKEGIPSADQEGFTEWAEAQKRKTEEPALEVPEVQITDTPLPPAPATFTGVQRGVPGIPDFELYNLTEDIPGHPSGSTVTRETLENAGYEVPEMLIEEPPAPKAEEPKVELPPAPAMMNPEDVVLPAKATEQEPGTRAKDVTKETVTVKAKAIQAYIDTLPHDEAKRAYARALVEGLRTGNLPPEPTNLVTAEIQAIQAGLMKAVSTGSLPKDASDKDLVQESAQEQKGETPETAVAQVSQSGVTFETSKGSTYSVGNGGSTTRTKALRAEHPGDSGLKPPSETTFYVDQDGMKALAEITTEGAGPKRIIAQMDDGRVGVKYLDGKDAGKFEKRTVVTPQKEPAVGLYPVELWRGGKEYHFGNKITKVSKPDKAKIIPTRGPKPSMMPDELIAEKPKKPQVEVIESPGVKSRRELEELKDEFEKAGSTPITKDTRPQLQALVDRTGSWPYVAGSNLAVQLERERNALKKRLSREPNEGSYYASVEGHAAMEAAEEAQWQRAPDRAKASLKEWIENEGQKGLTRLRDAALRLWSGRSDVSTDEDAETLQELYDSGEPIRDLLKTRAKNGKVTLYRGLRNATRKEESPSVQSYTLDRGIAGDFAGENGTVETVQVNVDDVIAMASTAEMEVLVRGKAKQPVAQPVTPENIVDQSAHEAATSPTNEIPQPTQAQKEAGNYAKGHVTIAGLDISIENPAGSTRSGTDANGKSWSVTIKSHYGYLLGTKGKDKDHLDVFIKPGTPEDYAGSVFVIDQMKPGTKTFDEHKIIFGVKTSKEARELYLSNYAKDWNGLGSISMFSMPQFKGWLKNGDHTKPAVNYKIPVSYTVTEAEIVPTRMPDGSVKYVAKNVKEESVTPTDIAQSKASTAPTPEEVTHGRTERPRVGDTRPPEGVSPEDVSGVESIGKTQRVGQADAGPGQRTNGKSGERGPVSTRSVGDREGGRAPASRGGRAESGGDETAVQRTGDAIPAGTDFIIDADYTIPKGQKTKYRANVTAIKLLKSIEADGRVATPDEQAILAQYTGWGGLPQAFQYSNDWRNEYREIEELLTADEYAAARASTTNAHYTNPELIRSIYRGLQHLGFKGGRVLEPGSGIGHFFGAMPSELAARSQRTAIERDSLSARLAKQLYQQANIIEHEYQKTTLPDNFFDVAIGNVPFADVKIFDAHNKTLSDLRLSLHDYYFAKALTQVRPGGLVAFITSRYTMDKVNGKMRDYIASQADLIGAIRLPDTQFKEIANTDVVTDLIILQKREPGTPAGGANWTKTVNALVGSTDIVVNEYFKDLPEMILGTPSTKGSMYAKDSYTVSSDGRDMTQAMEESFARMPEKILRPRERPKSTTPRGLLEALEASDDVKEGALTIQNNALYVRRGSQFVPADKASPTDLERAKGLIGIREQVREVFKSQLAEISEKEMVAARQELTKRYDRFTKKFGPIHGRANKGLFGEDPDYPTLQALEKSYDAKTNTAKKADIFTKRVIEYRPKAVKADTAKEAMLISLNELGHVDFERMAELTGQPADAMQRDLTGILFKNPSGEWEPSDAYLSGNIRAKLKEAEAAAKIDKRFRENVEALKAVIPEDLAPAQIDVKLGHGWIPTDIYEQFIDHLLGVSRTKVSYNAHVGAYAVKANVYSGNTKNDAIYGTQRYKGTDLIADALASKLPTVYDKVDDKSVVNQKETLAAREKLSKIQEEFKKWLWDDAERARTLARQYNDEYNNVRLREYDGSHLTLPGINPLIELRPHQKNGIWRALQSGNTLLGHVVGAGKTYTMIGIAMEARRLRMANKPMFVVPNHLTEYWRKAIVGLYPAAKVLTVAKEDFQAANRKKLLGRISTGDWDAVVIAHSQLAKVPVSLETFETFVNEQVAILEDYLQELKQDKGGNRNIIKEIEKSKERFITKLERRKAEVGGKADLGVSFEETGVDMLLVDESDVFKNLYFPTRMTRVAGIPNTESQRAYDMFLKTQYLNKITKQHGVIFATGTPISNSMAEVFTMQRYLQPQMLEQTGLSHFDSWARQFGETVTSMELAPDGSGYRPRTRFAQFVNVPELTQMFRQVMDVKLADDLKLPVPKLKTGKPINVTSKPGEALTIYTKTLIERAKNLKSVDPRVDNMLKITSDGRNAALDVRLRVPSAPEDKNGKVAKLVNNVVNTWKETSSVKGTQLIFLDLSTPKGEGKAKKSATEEDVAQTGEVDLAEETALRGSVYQDIKRKLIKGGIPDKDIAFIHDADTDAKKDRLFGDVNAGTVRVLMGSTEKMGAGTNVQQRMVALHNLDAPWRPRDIEQRNGRGIRQGNLLYDADPKGFEFAVYNYATEAPSFDVYMWQTLEIKAKTIAQVMKGDPNVRTIQDIDSSVLSYAEMKAIASGNPLILERVKAETELTKLSMLKSQQRDQSNRLRYELATIPGQVAHATAQIAALSKDRIARDAHPEDPLSITIDQTKYQDAEEAGMAILSFVKDAISNKRSEATEVDLGTYRGFNLRMKVYLDGDAVMFLSRAGSVSKVQSTTFTKDAKADGLIERLNNALNKMEQIVTQSESAITHLQSREKELKAEIDRPFEQDAKISALTARLAEIDKALDLTNKDEGIVGGDEKTSGITPTDIATPKQDEGPLDILGSERGSIPVTPFGSTPKYSKDAEAYRKQRAEEERGFISSDADIETRVRAAKQGVLPESLGTRIKENAAHVWHLVSREFEHLPDTAEFSPLRTSLLQLQKYKGIAADAVQRDLAEIIKPLSRKQYDQFEWKALLSDLKREAEQERALPFGYTPEKVAEDLERLDAVIAGDPVVQEAWKKRQDLWTSRKRSYQAAMDAIGFDTSRKLTKEDYFRHQVLEYSRERYLKGTGSQVRTPTGRGFLQARHGSTMDINANYVQAEFEVMTQMVYDTKLAKVVRGVDESYNIRRELAQQAKDMNNAQVQRIIDQGDLLSAMVETQMKDFRKRIGMNMSQVRKALDLDKTDPLTMEMLAEIADDAESPGNMAARGIFKAISERKAFVKDLLGKNFATWQSIIPETHDLWQPREGNVFYMADSIPAQLAKVLQEGLLSEVGLTADKLHKVLAMGNEREQYVIPKEAKLTLDGLSQKEHSWFVDANRHVINLWKQLMLVAPRRVIRYNVRNLTGDADALFVGNPGAFKKFPQAGRELIPVIFKETLLEGEAKQWVERGGYGTTLQTQELGEINDLKAFRLSLDRAATGGWLKAPATLWNAYWKSARLSTDYRESIGRYAAYLDYLEQMQASPQGRPKNFGASRPDSIMALSDIRDRAFKLSNELLGAYDRVSVAGQTLRSFWIPFWSWQEVNATRYAQLVKNALHDGTMAESLSKMSLIGARKAAWALTPIPRGLGPISGAAFLIRLAAFWSTLQAWNYLAHGDDEDELKDTNPAVAHRPHLLMGRDESGKIRYLAGIGALGDLLSWVGLDEFPGLVGDIMHDRMTMGEAVKRAVKAPVNKLWGGITPTVKMPVELAFRQSTYPDVFQPRPINDRVDYLAYQTTLGPEIMALRGKPGKPLYGGEDVTGLLVQRTDPQAASYWTWQGIERKHLERMGKESSAVFWRSARGEALLNWSKSIEVGDSKAEATWRNAYEQIERDKYGMKFTQTKMYKDIEQSLRSKAPLAGMTVAEREATVATLDEQERRTLDRAEAYYKEHMLLVLPEVRRKAFTRKLERKHWLTKPTYLPQELLP